nr:transmembrane protein 243 isoform X2 [Mirounga angustirostris]
MAQSGGVNISICREETEAQDLWHQWPGQQTSVRRNVGQGCKSGMRKLSRDGPANHFLGRHRDGHLKMKGHGSTVKARLTTGICNQLVGIWLCCLDISDSAWLPHLNLFTVFFLWVRELL